MKGHPEKPHLMDSGSSVMMGTKRFVADKKRIIKVLDKCESPMCKAESAKQKRELINITKSKGKGSMPVTKMRRDSGSSMGSSIMSGAYGIM
jgi:hypothetical protein